MASLRRRAVRSSGWLALLAVAGLPCAPLPVAAQQGQRAALDLRSPLQGVVLEESTLRPIEAATVILIGADMSTRTDADGAFAFANTPSGRVRVRVTSPGRVSMVQEVEVHPDAILHVQFLLPRIDVVLAGFLVTGSADATSGAPVTAADLVARQVPGLLYPVSSVGDTERGIRLRGTNTFTQAGDPHLFVDGIRVTGTGTIYDALTQIPAENVDRIEVLRGPAAAFLHPYAANGVIHVYTKSRGGVRPH